MPPPWLKFAWRPTVPSTIVFAHGAVVNGLEMIALRRQLAKLGYSVRQFQYDSMRTGFDTNVARLRKFVRETKGDAVHIVGHSMGGVLARHAFEHAPDPRPGRLVAIGSPLTDCWVGRRFGRWHARMGPYLTGRTVHDYLARPSEPVWRGDRDFGVLAGTFPFGVGTLFRDLPSPSDGVVLWEETRLHGLADHLTFRLNHFGMLFSRRCCREIARFLATGRFESENGVERASP